MVLSRVAVSEPRSCRRTRAARACTARLGATADEGRGVPQESVRALAAFSRRTYARSVARSNGTTIASMMLAPCSASSVLSASLRPGLWPGLRALTTPARGTDWQLRDGGHLMTVHNDVDATTTRAYGGPIVSAARHSFGSPQRHPERAFRRPPQGHGLERIPLHLRSLIAASPRAVGCTMRLRPQCLSRCRVLRTTRRKEAAFSRAWIAPWFV